MDLLTAILVAMGGNAVAIAALGFLAKKVLDSTMARDQKRFDAELKTKSDVAIERLKADLHIAAIEHQVAFSKLHEKRANVIATLYGLLVETLWKAESFLSLMEWAGEPPKTEKYKSAMGKLVELYRYFDRHRIYLLDHVTTALEKLIADVRSHVTHFGIWLHYTDAQLQDDSIKKKMQAWENGWNAIKNDVPAARQALERELRSLLAPASQNQSGPLE